MTYVKHRISNAVAEGLDSKYSNQRGNAQGYRSIERFRNGILFFCGGRIWRHWIHTDLRRAAKGNLVLTRRLLGDGAVQPFHHFRV